MITGDIRNQIDRVWDAFWSGGISNPLEDSSQSGQPLVAGGRIYPVEILLPPTALQMEFANVVAHAEALLARHKSSHDGLDALFVSLRHRAFRGEL